MGGGEDKNASTLQQFPYLTELIASVSARDDPYWTLRLMLLLKSHGIITDSSAGLSGDGRPSQGAVQEALTDATVVPIGNDPSTKFGGLFGPEALDVLTAAHSAESSINMLMLASGLPEDKVRELLRAWTSNALDVLRSKPSGKDRPAIAQLRSDSKVMVKKLIKLVMSKPDKTVVALFCGWLPDLLLQWGFNTADIKYQARVRLDGTNGLADHGVQHSSGDIGDVISSRMMPAACAHRHLKLPHARGPRPRPTHEPLPLTAACSLSPLLVCCVCQSQARP